MSLALGTQLSSLIRDFGWPCVRRRGAYALAHASADSSADPVRRTVTRDQRRKVGSGTGGVRAAIVATPQPVAPWFLAVSAED